MLSCYPAYVPSICHVELQLEWLQWLRSDCWCINLRQYTCARIPRNGEFTAPAQLMISQLGLATSVAVMARAHRRRPRTSNSGSGARALRAHFAGAPESGAHSAIGPGRQRHAPTLFAGPRAGAPASACMPVRMAVGAFLTSNHYCRPYSSGHPPIPLPWPSNMKSLYSVAHAILILALLC